MVYFSDGLGLSSLFFTTADFDDALLTMDGILKMYETRKGDSILVQDPAESKAMLERVYKQAMTCLSLCGARKPDKQLIFLLGDTIREYGHLCYQENFFIGKQIFLVAFQLQLYAMEFVNDCLDLKGFSSLEELTKHAKGKPNLFAAVEELILSMNIEACIAAAFMSTFAQSYPSRRLFNLADTIRWLGHCYQHIDKYQDLQPVNDLRYRQLFTLSEGIFLLMDDEKGRKELGDLYFQASPYMHQRQKGEDAQGICALYNKALACDDSPEMQVRVANMRFLTLFKAQQREEALYYLQQALAGIKKLPDTEQNRFLTANVHSNYAAYYMDPQTVDLEQAQMHLDHALKYAEKCRSVGEDRFYFAFYDMRAAELKLALGDYVQSKKYIDKAIATLNKNPESQRLYIGKAEALQSIIVDALKFGPKFFEP